MNNMEDFDKSFNRMKKFVTCFIATVFIIIILGFIGIITVSIFAAKEVNNKGLKGVIERIWNGKGQ